MTTTRTSSSSSRQVSAYARAGRQCRHNRNYWTFGDYLGVGAGAHGKITFAAEARIVRTTQQREPRRYQAADPGALAQNSVAAADLPFEFMMNALRLTDGFAQADFTARTGLDWTLIEPTIQRLVARGLVAIEGRMCKTTALGARFLNDVLVEFLPQKPVLAGKRVMSTAS